MSEKTTNKKDQGIKKHTRREVLTKASGAAAATVAAATIPRITYGETKKFKVAIILPSFDQQRWKAADGEYFNRRAEE